MLGLILLTGSFSLVQLCSVQIPDADRRDCYPWPDLTPAKCEARGCVYCPHGVGGVPWCFADDSVCPSEIPENERVDCHPLPGASSTNCNQKGCIWCEPSTQGVPACFYDTTVDQGGEYCPPDIPETERVDCWPHSNVPATKENCMSRDCYWCETATSNVPWCFKPVKQGYYITNGPTATMKGWTMTLARHNSPTWFGGDINTLAVDVEFQENERLRVKMYDPNKSRWEVPLNINSPATKAANPLYDITFDSDPFAFKVIRKSNGEVLFDTSLGGMVYADQAIQFGAKLASEYMYGWGESEHHSFAHDMNWKEWGMFARDQPVMQGNLYGVHPFFTNLDSNGDLYGCLILNSNAQEIKTMPAPGFIYRTMGGILDFYFFLGPKPEQVIQQYTQAIGKPYMPPYWSLGFHMARYGYDSLAEMKLAVDRLRLYDIPHDVQYCDIDCFDRHLDFTYNTVEYAGLPEYVAQLRTEGTRFIVILDPCIAVGEPAGTYPTFTRGNAANAWVKQADWSSNALGRVWPSSDVYFPDYSRPSAQDWWIDECVRYHETLAFDGLWLDMNEPANFVAGSVTGCSYNEYNNPIWKPRSILGNELYEKTVCMDYQQTMGLHYDTHSLYGWSEAEPTLRAARASTGGTRSLVISRSTFPGAGQHAVNWLGDNFAQWSNLHYSIIGMLEFNMFGIPFIGADICGYMGDSNEQLCQRWMQLGSFYTYARNHNGKGWLAHDPGQWPEVARVSRETLNIRYTLLPYLYTLFHHVNTQGGSVVRPLFYEFPEDTDTYTIDRQFMWGEAFLVTPVIDQDAVTVRGYFPNARWYGWYTGRDSGAKSMFVTLQAPMDFIPLHLRGGYVIPTQQPANSTMWSRQNPMGLIVTYDLLHRAEGDLFWDEGDTVDSYDKSEYVYITYSAIEGRLTGSVQNNGYDTTGLHYGEVQIWGENRAISSVSVDTVNHADFTYNSLDKVLTINNLNLPIRFNFEITWS